MAIFREHLRAERGALIGWALGVGLYFVWIASTYPMVVERFNLPQMLQQYPGGIKAMIGEVGAWPSLKAYIQIYVLSFLPVLVAYFGVAFGAGTYTREIDKGTAEFLFTLPVTRTRVVLARMAGFVAASGLLHACVYAMALAAAALLGEPPEATPYLRAVALAWLVNVTVGALSLWVTSFFSDYSKAVLATTGLVFGLYFAGLAVQATQWRNLVLWSPFGRYNVYEALWGRGFPWADAGVLVAMAAVFLVAALVHIERREIYL